MRFSTSFFQQLLVCGLALSTFAACEKDDDDMLTPEVPNTDQPFATGLTGGDNMSTVPVKATFSFGNGTLPTKASVEQYLPPMGDQGTYGTCVAWAVGYNLKTALNAIANNETGQTLAQPNRQGSPRYLFTNVADNIKGANCYGTDFEPAFEVMINKGISTMADVPYTNLGNCAQSLADASWDVSAGNNKIASYRKIEGSIESIKRAIVDNQPVAVGVKTGEAFQQHRGDGVLTSIGTFDPSAPHGLHAMAIVGYDDSKGPNGAFRLVNSWGTIWGDAGFGWVDYNFFMQEMVMNQNGAVLFTASNSKGTKPDDNNTPQNNPTGADLLTWIYEESINPQSQDGRDRTVVYDIYNFGTQAARSSSEWDIYYVYYNAYDARDYGVLIHNKMTGTIQANTFNCADAGCNINVDISANSSLGLNLRGEEGISQGYRIPQLNGDYFLMMVADGELEIAEADESDNYFFPSLIPVRFNNGIPSARGTTPSAPGRIMSGNKPNFSELASGQLRPQSPHDNAYTPEEIQSLVKQELKNGNLAQKAAMATVTGLRGRANASTH